MKESKYVPIVLTVLLVSACLGAFAYAANNSTEVIYACANRTNGQMRLASSPSDCKKPEIALSWNQAGPEGPQGAPGEQGPPASLSDDFKVFTNIGTFEANTDASLSAGCDDAGWAVIGRIPPQANSEAVEFEQFQENIAGTAVTWFFDTSGANEDVQVTVGVICMRVPPSN